MPLAFSDHFAHVVEFIVPQNFKLIIRPKNRASFKLKPDVIKDNVFKERLRGSLQQWERVLELSHQQGTKNESFLLKWWEFLVKAGIRKLGIERTKEIRDLSKESLNLLLIRQAYLTRKLQQGRHDLFSELQHVHLLIDQWYK